MLATIYGMPVPPDLDLREFSALPGADDGPLSSAYGGLQSLPPLAQVLVRLVSGPSGRAL
jgi:hypothetical protein